MKRFIYGFAFIILFVFSINNLQAKSYLGGHETDLKRTLEGVTGMNDVFRDISSGIDHDLATAWIDEFGKLPENHRIIGHWGFEGSIPFNEEPWKSAFKDYPKDKIRSLWQNFNNRLVDNVIAKTGLPRQQAQGVAGLIYNTHLLGDICTGNTRVDLVIGEDAIIRDINKNLHRLFGNNSQFVKEMEAKFSVVLKNKSFTSAQKADEVLKILSREKIGSKFYSQHARFLKPKGISYSETTASRMLAKAGYSSNKSVDSAKKFKGLVKTNTAPKLETKFTKTKVNFGVLQNISINGQEVQVLSVPAKIGLEAGIMTFIFMEGITTYMFIRGNISEQEFVDESYKNLFVSGATGAATYVAVALGATPTGWVVIGVGIGSAIIADFAFTSLREATTMPAVTLDDILGELPTSIQRRATIFDLDGYQSILDYNNEQLTIFDYDNGQETIFDYNRVRETILD